MENNFSLLLFILFFCALTSKGFSQSNGTDMPSVVPPSPEAAAMASYIDTPVSESTGIPNISIPLVELKGKDLNIPVSLSYQAGGIKVNQMATRVGLGWSLSAGGSISKSVRGEGDCQQGGFVNPYKTLEEFDQLPDRESYIQQNVTGNTPNDFQSDIYYFNFLGHSGKFFLKQISRGNVEAIQVKKSDIKIIPVMDGNKLESWIAITPDGVTYYFGTSKDGTRTAERTGSSISGAVPQLPPANPKEYIESWELMDIETNTGKVISFFYEDATIEFAQITSSDYVFKPTNEKVHHYYSITTTGEQRLTEIRNPNVGRVEFTYNMNRDDAKGDKALTDIELFDFNNTLIDAYELHQDYFVSTYNQTITFGDSEQKKKRLRLNSVVQKIANEENKTYSFDYNDVMLPNRSSYSQDFWGFFNGKSNGQLFPKVSYKKNGMRIPFGVGANRHVDPDKAKAGILKKITYPTGGYVTFDYEANISSYFPGGTTFGFDSYEKEHIADFSTLDVPPSPTSDWTEVFSMSVDSDLYEAGYNFINTYTNPCDPTTIDCPKVRIKMLDQSGGEITNLGIESNKDYNTFPLDEEVASIKVEVFYGSESDIDFIVNGYKKPDKGFEVGGLRVEKIQYYSKENELEKQKEYTYTLFNEPSTSSGVLINPQTYVNKYGYREVNLNGVIESYDIVKSSPLFPMVDAGSPILYTEVTVIDTKVGQFTLGGGDLKTQKTFSPPDNTGTTFGVYTCNNNCFLDVIPNQTFVHRQGLPVHGKMFKNNGLSYSTIQETTNNYTFNGEGGDDNTSQNIIYKAKQHQTSGGSIWEIAINSYNNKSERFYQTGTIKKQYFDTGDVETETEYTYDQGYNGRTFPIETKTSTSESLKKIITKTKYPNDMPSGEDFMSDLIEANRIAEPIEVQKFIEVNGTEELLNDQYTDYGYFDGVLRDSLYLPKRIKTLKTKGASIPVQQNDLENRIIYHDYDEYGNPIDISKANGIRISYIWGYNGQHPVAKIENRAYSTLPGGLVSQIKSETNEATLSGFLESLRNHPSLSNNAMVTTYTYKPLVGMSSVTDPKGDTQFFEYDEFGRLERVKDEQGNILRENEHHFRSQ